MGGNAFKVAVPGASFPRMSPKTYNSLKATLLPLVLQLYELVIVPPEAPEKNDHGDLDFMVAFPHPDLTQDGVKETLKAAYSLPQDGNRTSNFAIPINAFYIDIEDLQVDASVEGTSHVYFQVDLNVCANRDDWERAVFLHSYGDMGMILGVIGRAAGLSLGMNGAKLIAPLSTNPPISFHLTSSLSRVLEFYGLRKTRVDEGFLTQREVFEWTATSRLFDARRVAPSEQSHSRGKKRRGPRTMYQNFIDYARELAECPDYVFPRETFTKDDVLRFFGKEAEHNALINASRIKQNARETFTGKAVEQWTGMKGLPVRWVMDIARDRLNERKPASNVDNLITCSRPPEHEAETALLAITPWELALSEMSVQELQAMVVEIKGEMDAAGTFELNWQREREKKAAK